MVIILPFPIYKCVTLCGLHTLGIQAVPLFFILTWYLELCLIFASRLTHFSPVLIFFLEIVPLLISDFVLRLFLFPHCFSSPMYYHHLVWSSHCRHRLDGVTMVVIVLASYTPSQSSLASPCVMVHPTSFLMATTIVRLVSPSSFLKI